ncbi:MAG: hypothetical protein AABY89_01795, partial [Acidobacteriota bacterium]
MNIKSVVRRWFLVALAVISVYAVSAQGQVATRVTSPRMALGFDLGDDYQLANYTQLSAYWHKLDQESDRLSVVEYGKTSEGRPMLISIRCWHPASSWSAPPSM